MRFFIQLIISLILASSLAAQGREHPGPQQLISDQCGSWVVTDKGEWLCNDASTGGSDEATPGGACTTRCVPTCPYLVHHARLQRPMYGWLPDVHNK